jgi:hypothetical protein
MINLHKLLQKPNTFQRLTGLSPDKFTELLRKLTPGFDEAEKKRLSRPDRKRAIGAGNKRKLSLGQALFLLLLYYRTYINHVFIGMLGGIDDSNVGRYFGKIEPLLASIFRIPERNVKLSEKEIFELIIDATEQETERRKGTGYSGKKKRQTIKTQIAVTSEGTIKGVSKSVKGSVHDKKLYDQTRLFTETKIKKRGDLGYVGTGMLIPFKKPKNGALTDEQKQYNKGFSKVRIVVEHVIANMKKFRILTYRFRNSINTYNIIFKNVAGLRNFVMA